MPVGTRARPPAGGQHDAAAGDQIGAGVPGPGVGGQGQIGIEGEDGDLNHVVTTRTVEPDKVPIVLAWMDLEMTGLDPAARRHRRDRHPRDRRRPPDRRRRPRPGAGRQPPRRWTDGRCGPCDAHPERAADGHRRVDHGARGGRPGHLGLLQGSTSPSAARYRSAATRSRWTGGFSPPGSPRSTSTSTTARIDVSSVKELVRRWYPDAYANAPKKAGGHRALDDIKESVAELSYYRETVFKPAD